MVLELKAPHGTSLEDLFPLLPIFLSYVLSFVYVAIYWNNHHHTFQIVKHVDGPTLWANVHLLFWLSLIPFATAWTGENHFAPTTVALYGLVFLMSAIAYYILIRVLLSTHGNNSELAKAIGSDFKGKISVLFYVLAVIASFWIPYLALAIYFLVAVIWFIPDKRMEKVYKR